MNEFRYTATPDGKVKATVVSTHEPKAAREDLDHQERWNPGENRAEMRELRRAIEEAEHIQKIRNKGRKP